MSDTKCANMVGNICLDKNLPDVFGETRPITYRIMRVMDGSMFPGHNNRDHVFLWDIDCLQDAVRELHRYFVAFVEDDRYAGCNSFWLENYQAARSKWQTWANKQKHSFAYDNYKVCIVTSAGNIVY